MSKKQVVVFDFDGTLTSDDTFISFSRYALGDWRCAIGALRALPWLIGWKIGVVSSSKAKEKLFSKLYKGMSKAELMEISRKFMPRYKQESLDLLKIHQEKGDRVYIISASLDLWLNEIAKELGVRLICTNTTADNAGHLDGTFSSSNCHGEEKVKRLKEEENGDYYLTVYGNEPDGGDAGLYDVADKFIVIK